MTVRVLIVEDEEAMAVALRDGFTYEGYDVVEAHDGVAALEAVEREHPDIVILDVMLPRMTGLEVCKRLRAAGRDLPVIMLTARGQEIDRVLGLKLGADDYVTKPFSFMELVARVEAVMRRSRGTAGGAETRLEFGDVVVDFAAYTASKAGRPLELTPREMHLLRYLADHREEVVSREQLLDAVWGYDSIPFTRTVDTHIAKLRKKIEDNPSDPRFIITVHRIGYRFLG